MPRQTAFVLILIALGAVLSALRNTGQVSPDLLATWMAGLNFARGAFDQIYPAAAGPAFEMHPPEAWVAELRAQGHDGAIFPFIYPPLWAWAASVLTRVTDYARIVAVANVLNPVLLGFTLWLAARTVRGALSDAVFVSVGLLMFATTAMALVALEQNQPQILVAFLTVLAAERATNSAPRAAGIALALAASIKLYPALFALLWLARGERRPVAAFAVTGAALGLLSIALAGWPLHALFLEQIRTISGSVLVTSFTYDLDAVAAKYLFGDALTFVPDLLPGSEAGWKVLAKPPLWKAIDAALILAAIAALALLARRSRDPLVWPLAVTLVALASPLSWGYHYLAALAFLPALLDRLGAARGILASVLLLAPSTPAYILSDLPVLAYHAWSALLGTLAMAAYAALLLRLVLGPEPAAERPLRSDPAQL